MSRAQRGLRARRPESLFTVTPVAEVLDLDRNPVTSNRNQIRHCWLYIRWWVLSHHSSSSDDSVKDKEVTRLLLVKTLSLLLVVDKPACPLYVSSCGLRHETWKCLPWLAGSSSAKYCHQRKTTLYPCSQILSPDMSQMSSHMEMGDFEMSWWGKNSLASKVGNLMVPLRLRLRSCKVFKIERFCQI